MAPSGVGGKPFTKKQYLLIQLKNLNLKELISDIIRKSWNATRFMEGVRRLDRQCELRTLWADKRLVDFDLKTGPNINFS